MAGSAIADERAGGDASADARPNVVWIISEDNSKHYLRHFDPDGAPTPAIEAMAQHGVTFDRAFSNAPVCSVARTALITGCHAPRLATQFHRPIAKPSIGSTVDFFPLLLRRAGYHTTNNAKEDYNAIVPLDVWDQSGKTATWKDRSNNQPFFHVRTFFTTHESRLQFDTESMQTPTQTNPDDIVLPLYLPDTQTFRHTAARYHDQITAMDQQVGEVIDELSSAGVLEDTFVFYFSDHGGVLPRSKGYLYETGLHVPLVVRIPENFRDSVDRDYGDRTDGFVQFVDFAPTVLSLCEVEHNASFDGQSFLGPNVSLADVDRRNETMGYVDRLDCRCDLDRSLRIGDMKYIRRFEPIFADSLTNLYRYKMLAQQQWRTMHREGELTPEQSAFFEPAPPEALYDLSVDPEETNNLAGDPQHRNDLLRMRSKLTERLKQWPDLSFMTELYVIDMALGDPETFGKTHVAEITRLIDTVNLGLQPYQQVKPLLVQSIEDTDPLVRYWGIVAAMTIGPDAAELLPSIQKKMLDVEPFVVAKAIEFCAMHGPDPPAVPLSGPDLVGHRFDDVRPFLYRSLNRVLDESEALLVLRTAVHLSEAYPGRFPLEMKRAGLDMLQGPTKMTVDDYWKYLESIQP